MKKEDFYSKKSSVSDSSESEDNTKSNKNVQGDENKENIEENIEENTNINEMDEDADSTDDKKERQKNSFIMKSLDKFKKIDSFRTNKKSFATGLGFYKLFWVFFIGCFVGVVIEVLFCIFVTEHRYESRQGLIYGPFNPVYGFGAIAMTIVLYFFRKKSETWIFLVGAVIGALFETLCSVYQEYFLGTVSWDYTGSKYSLMGGRTDLVFAIFWGILAVIWIKFIYPFMSNLIEKIPNKIGVVLTWVLLVFMIFDCIISCMAVDRMVKRHNGTADNTVVGNFLDEHYPDEFLLSVYPNMIFTDTGEVLHEIAGKNDDKSENNQTETESSNDNTDVQGDVTDNTDVSETGDTNSEQSENQNAAAINMSFSFIS